MKAMYKKYLLFGVAFALTYNVYGWDILSKSDWDSAFESAGNAIESTAQKTGADIKKAAEQTGNAIKDAGETVVSNLKTATRLAPDIVEFGLRGWNLPSGTTRMYFARFAPMSCGTLESGQNFNLKEGCSIKPKEIQGKCNTLCAKRYNSPGIIASRFEVRDGKSFGKVLGEFLTSDAGLVQKGLCKDQETVRCFTTQGDSCGQVQVNKVFENFAQGCVRDKKQQEKLCLQECNKGLRYTSGPTQIDLDRT